ncbi:MAG: hypothetical protein MHMPM18_001116 [Marteilia pararefringens]
MIKQRIVIGNWKLNNVSEQETLQLIADYRSETDGKPENVDLAFCPVDVFLQTSISELSKLGMKEWSVGAQNCCYAASGAFTGEISCKALENIGCRLTLIGHSERRQLFGEDEALISKKIDFIAGNSKLKIILCIGETLEEYKSGKTSQVISAQLSHVVQNMDKFSTDSLIIAYEPIWAIGTGITPTIQEIKSSIDLIKKELEQVDKKSSKGCFKVLYGGSVNSANCEEISKIEICDGFLVGGASLKPKDFAKIITMCGKYAMK